MCKCNCYVRKSVLLGYESLGIRVTSFDCCTWISWSQNGHESTEFVAHVGTLTKLIKLLSKLLIVNQPEDLQLETQNRVLGLLTGTRCRTGIACVRVIIRMSNIEMYRFYDVLLDYVLKLMWAIYKIKITNLCFPYLECML